MKKLILFIYSASLLLGAQETIKVPTDKTVNITINNNNNNGDAATQSTSPIIESQKQSGWGETRNNYTNQPSIFSSRSNYKDRFYVNLGVGSFYDNEDDEGGIGHFSLGYSWGITSNFNLSLELGSYAGAYEHFITEFEFVYLALKGEFFLTPSVSLYAKLVSPSDLTITDLGFLDLETEIDNFVAIGISFWFTKTFGISAEAFDFQAPNIHFANFSILTFQLNFKF